MSNVTQLQAQVLLLESLLHESVTVIRELTIVEDAGEWYGSGYPEDAEVTNLVKPVVDSVDAYFVKRCDSTMSQPIVRKPVSLRFNVQEIYQEETVRPPTTATQLRG